MIMKLILTTQGAFYI